ncbi:MAG: hypothetical protein Q4G33_04585 [bacterium]|nr:hypothetical protein [bacterium]
MPEKYKDSGKWFWGILAAASPKDIELYRQNQHPVTHTIVQHGTIETADEENLLYVEGDGAYSVSVKPSPKGIDTTMIYHVEERRDLNERIEWNCSGDGGQDKNSNSAENAEGC